MTVILALMLSVLCGGTVLWWWQRRVQRARRAFIRNYHFPAAVLAKFRERHPELDKPAVAEVARCLRMFFIVWVRSGFRPVGMPSRVVDDLWHEFICDTRAYASFCQRAFGRFFHHVPASDEPVEGDDPVALRRTWRWACLVEGMDPRRPKQLPKLFAVDARLAVAGGFAFHLTWQGANWSGDDESKSACGGGGGGCSGLATADGPAACGGGCSGGGGGGCGGGCGGG